MGGDRLGFDCAAERARRHVCTYIFQQILTDKADYVSDRICPGLSDNIPHYMKIKMYRITENFDYMDKIMFSTILLTFITTHNGIHRYHRKILSE